MTNISELRRLAQAATPGPWLFNGRAIKRDYRNIGLSADAGETIATVTGGKTSGPFFIEDDNECIANARLIAATNPATLTELLDRLEAAEVAWKESDKACRDLTEKVIPNIHAECAALRAELEALKDQKTVAWLHETRSDSDVVTDAVKHVWGRVAVGSLAAYSIPLVIKHGAQGEQK